MKSVVWLSLVAIFSIPNFAVAQNPSSQAILESHLKAGQPMPSFTVTDIAGQQIKMGDLKGKVVLVNFWATWCPPCRAEMPRLQKEIWEKYKSDKFTMVGIAREQSLAEIKAFRNRQGYTYPLAADPHRKIYKLFADAGIPRNYVVGPDGRIVFQSVGYSPDEFEKLKQVIQQQLAELQADAR